MPTTYSQQNVFEFIETLDSEKSQKDSLALIEAMQKITSEKPKMFGSSIIGFGEYFYKYDSGHSGSAPLLGFSPRKKAISLYVYTGLEEHKPLLENLGKFTMGKACIYIKKLEDINLDALESLMAHTVHFLENKYKRLS